MGSSMYVFDWVHFYTRNMDTQYAHMHLYNMRLECQNLKEADLISIWHENIRLYKRYAWHHWCFYFAE